MSSDTNGQMLNITTTKSSYECFNECIKNPLCASATCLSHKKFNCYLKSKYDLYKFPPIDAEIVRIIDYKNQAILNNLPYNGNYRFRVMVYDFNSDKWSEFSDPSSNEIEIKISNFIQQFSIN